eukprot:Awhi_evm1s3778
MNAVHDLATLRRPWNFSDYYILHALEKLKNENPDKLMYCWLDEKANIVNSYTRVEFWNASRALGSALRTKYKIEYGDRVMVLDIDIPKFKHFVADSGANIALTSKSFRRIIRVSSIRHKWPKKLKWIAIDSYASTSSSLVDNFHPVSKVNPDVLALIQYTSGSTGQPKEVMITHRNIAAQFHMHQSFSDIPGFNKDLEGISLVSWVPQYHDLGLIYSYLSHASMGSTGYLMSPLTFLRNPLIWLEAIERYRPSVIVGPNFSFGLVANRLTRSDLISTFDVSSVQCVISGGEPTEPNERDIAFDVIGLKKSAFFNYYGLAEHTLAISLQGNIERNRRISAGNILYVKKFDIDIRIVNSLSNDDSVDELRELPPGIEGEVVVKSNSVAAGYWNNEEATKATFQAEVKRIDGSTGIYLPTGDIGYIDPDGELFIMSRLKDLIIFSGRNYAPNDIERAAERVDPTIIRPGSAVAFQPPDNSKDPVLIVELREDKYTSVPISRLMERIRLAVGSTTGLYIESIILVKARTVPKTTSGKVQRRELVRRWQAGELSSYIVKERHSNNSFMNKATTDIPQLESPEAESWLCKRVALILEVPEDMVDPSTDLMSLGLTSISTVALANELENLSRLQVPNSFLNEHNTVRGYFRALCALGKAEGVTYPEVVLPVTQLILSTRLPPVIFALCQALGIFFIWTLATTAVLPSYYFGYWAQFELSTEPWSYISVPGISFPLFGLLLPFVIPLWFTSFSVIMILCKWIIIGRYSDNVTIPLNTVEFLRWWWIDRLVEFWEVYMGRWIK